MNLAVRRARAGAWLTTGTALVLISGCATTSAATAPVSASTTSVTAGSVPADATSDASLPMPHSAGRYWPCVNPSSAQDVADLYSGVTTAVRARVTDDRTTSPLAFGSVATPTPGTEVLLQDVQVLWGAAPASLTLYEDAPVGEGIPDGEYVLVLMPLEPQRGLYQLGMGPFGAYGVDDAGGLRTYCIDYSDPGWKHQAPDVITADALVADLTGAFGVDPTPPPGLDGVG